MSTGPHAPASISSLNVSSQLSRQKHAGYSPPISPDTVILLVPEELYLPLQDTWERPRWLMSAAMGRRAILELLLYGAIVAARMQRASMPVAPHLPGAESGSTCPSLSHSTKSAGTCHGQGSLLTRPFSNKQKKVKCQIK